MKLQHAVRSAIVLRELPLDSLTRSSSATLTPVGDWVLIATNTPGISSLVSGWHSPEPWGVWSSDHESVIALYYAEAPERDVRIEFDVWALVSAGALAQAVEVSLDGLIPVRWNFTGSENRGLRVVDFPCSSIKRTPLGATLTIRFRTSALMSPMQRGLSNDNRPLGFALAGFRQSFVESQADGISAPLLSPIERRSEEATLELPARSSHDAGRFGFRSLFAPARILRWLARRSRRLLLKAVAASRPGQVDGSAAKTEALVMEHAESIRAMLLNQGRILAEIRMATDLIPHMDRVQASSDGELSNRLDRIVADLADLSAKMGDVSKMGQSAIISKRLLDQRIDPQLVALRGLTAKVHRQLTHLGTSSTADVSDAPQVSRELEVPPADDRYVLRESIESRLEELFDLSAKLHPKLDRLVAATDRLSGRFVFSLTDDALAISNPYGFLVVPREDVALVAHLAEGRIPEPGTLKVLERLVDAGSTFVDVGANVGIYTLFAACRVGPTGRVISIEPIPRLAALLRRMVQMNGITDRVEIDELAIGSRVSSVELNIAMPYGLSSIYPLSDSRQSILVRMSSLDELLRGRRPTVIKVDAEGAELEVLRGLKSTIENNDDVAIVMEYGPTHLERAGFSISQWFSTIREFGLDIWEIDEQAGHLRPLRQTDLDKIYSINLLLARRLPEAVAAILEGKLS
jgi:FkbM family methyltransferase